MNFKHSLLERPVGRVETTSGSTASWSGLWVEQRRHIVFKVFWSGVWVEQRRHIGYKVSWSNLWESIPITIFIKFPFFSSDFSIYTAFIQVLLIDGGNNGSYLKTMQSNKLFVAKKFSHPVVIVVVANLFEDCCVV